MRKRAKPFYATKLNLSDIVKEIDPSVECKVEGEGEDRRCIITHIVNGEKVELVRFKGSSIRAYEEAYYKLGGTKMKLMDIAENKYQEKRERGIYEPY
jgi:hypothetical protein